MQEMIFWFYALWLGFWTIVRMHICNNLGDTSCWQTGCWHVSLPLQLEFCFSMEMYIWLVIVLLIIKGSEAKVALPKFHGCKMNQVPIPWTSMLPVQRTIALTYWEAQFALLWDLNVFPRKVIMAVIWIARVADTRSISSRLSEQT